MVNTKHQSVQMINTTALINVEHIDPGAFRTFFPIFNREGGKRDRFSPQNYLGLTATGLNYDAAKRALTFPTLWGLIPSGSKRSGNFDRVNDWLPIIGDPDSIINDFEAGELTPPGAKSPVRSQAMRVSYQYARFRRALKSNYLVVAVSKIVDKLYLGMNETAVRVAVDPIEEMFDFDEFSTSTPPNVSYAPVGLGYIGERGKVVYPTRSSILSNLIGIWNMSSAMPPIPVSKTAKWAILYSFASYALVTGNLREEGEISGAQGRQLEQLLIDFTFTVETLWRNNVVVKSWNDMISWLPVFSRHKLFPSLATCFAKLSESAGAVISRLVPMQEWLYSLYMFLKSVTLMKDLAGFKTFCADVQYVYTINASNSASAPSPIEVQDCFLVQRRIQIKGNPLEPRAYQVVFKGTFKFFPPPADSSILASGVVPILSFIRSRYTNSRLETGNNKWRIIVEEIAEHCDSALCQIDRKYPIVPELTKNSLDMNCLNFTCEADLGMLRDIIRHKSDTDELALIMSTEINLKSCRFDLPSLLLVGGVPIYDIDSYIEVDHRYFHHNTKFSPENYGYVIGTPIFPGRDPGEAKPFVGKERQVSKMSEGHGATAIKEQESLTMTEINKGDIKHSIFAALLSPKDNAWFVSTDPFGGTVDKVTNTRISRYDEQYNIEDLNESIWDDSNAEPDILTNEDQSDGQDSDTSTEKEGVVPESTEDDEGTMEKDKDA